MKMEVSVHKLLTRYDLQIELLRRLKQTRVYRPVFCKIDAGGAGFYFYFLFFEYVQLCKYRPKYWDSLLYYINFF